MPGIFSPPHGLTIPTCTTARSSRTCRDACRYRLLAVSFEVGGGESVPGIPGACASPSFTYLPRGPWDSLLYTARNTVEWFAECHIMNIIFTIFSDFWQNNVQLWNRERTKKIPSFGLLMLYGIIESQQTFKKWHQLPICWSPNGDKTLAGAVATKSRPPFIRKRHIAVLLFAYIKLRVDCDLSASNVIKNMLYYTSCLFCWPH